jgi:hypothetical protein
MTEEKNAYLGKCDTIKVGETEFKIRGLSFKETLTLGDILGKMIFSSLKAVSADGEVNADVATALLQCGISDLQRVEGILCDVMGKSHGFLMEQDPEYFSAVLFEVLGRTNIKAMKENFTKAASSLGLKEDSLGVLSSLLPKS